VASSTSSPLAALMLEVASFTHKVEASGPRALVKLTVVCGFLVSWRTAGGIAVPLVLYGVYRLLREVAWFRKRTRVLAEEGFRRPTFAGAVKAHNLEWRRARHLRRQWEVACTTSKLTGGRDRIPPTLRNLRSDVNGDMIASIRPGELGVSVDKILKNAAMIAEVIGCRELIVTHTTIGAADLLFMWTEAIAQVLPASEVPPAPKGRIAYGIRRDGSPATIAVGTHVLVSGMTGSGKSGITWDVLGYLNAVKLPYWLYFSSPKGGVEGGSLADKVDKPQGPLTVKYFARSLAETADMIVALEAAMKDRQDAQTVRKWTVDQAAEIPLIVVVFDELVEVMRNLKPEHKVKLLTVLSQIRASGGMVIGSTQLAQKNVLEEMRDMFPERLSLAQRNAINTDMALGDGAEAAGARCSKLRTPQDAGLGFSFDETRRGYDLFRAGWCSDADVERISRGLPPVGMGVDAAPKGPAQHGIYLLHTKRDRYGKRILYYVGETDNPRRRLFEEHSNPTHKDFKPWWSEIVLEPGDVYYVTGKTPELAKAAAKREEARLIRDLLPLYNDKLNGGNPMKLAWRKGQRLAHPLTAEPDEIDVELAELLEDQSPEPSEDDVCRHTCWHNREDECDDSCVPAEATEETPEPRGPEETVTPDPATVEVPTLPPVEVPTPDVPSRTSPGAGTSRRYSRPRQASAATLERQQRRREAAAKGEG
jgi:hypothetical protein